MSWWDTFYQQIANGLVLGSIYVLIAVGFTLCLSVLRLINLAQGHFLMLGAFITIQFYGGIHQSGWFADIPVLSNYFVCLILAAVFVGIIGIGVHFAGISTVRDKGPVAPILTTIALAFLIENIARVEWSDSVESIDTSLSDNVRNPFGHVYITDQMILIIISGIVLVLALYTLLQRTRIGKALRATTQDETTASLMGINPQFMFVLAIFMAAAFAAIAGGLLGSHQPVETTMGLRLLFKAMIVVLIGGTGNVLGALIGGMLLGLMESLIIGWWDSSWVNVTTFGVIILILIIRPGGLMGGKRHNP